MTEFNEQLFALARAKSEYDITSMPWLPQLPEAWAQETYERIEAAERGHIAPNLVDDEYNDGTATYPDEVLTIQQGDDTGVLFTADHATRPISIQTGKSRFPDAGTGGLVAVLAEDFGTGLIMIGRQTTNVPSVDEHPIKDEMRLHLPTADGFVAVHGMARGKFMKSTDRTEIQATIGLGPNPTEAMHDFARRIVRDAKDDLGLYVTIGNDGEYFVQKENSHELKLNDDGTPFKNRLAALKPTMTTNVARNFFSEQQIAAPALQIELTKMLRLATTKNETRDHVSKVIGVALGYELLKLVTELTYLAPPSEV